MYYTVPPLTGQRIVVTGANSGTGFEASLRLALAGATVVLGVRSVEKGERAAEQIRAQGPNVSLKVIRLDLADLSSIHSFATALITDGKPLHGLLNNAGVMVPPQRQVTVDGFELQFGTNFLGPFALTNLLLPALLAAPGARVATMSSGTANFGRIDFNDLQWLRRSYSPGRAYAQSKLADLLLGRWLAVTAQRRGWDLLSAIAHPGYTRTNLQTAGRNLGRDADAQLPPIRRTLLPSQSADIGAEPLLYAATSPAAKQGAYYGPRTFALVGPTHQASIPRSARSHNVAQRLWAEAERLTSTRLPDDTAD